MITTMTINVLYSLQVDNLAPVMPTTDGPQEDCDLSVSWLIAKQHHAKLTFGNPLRLQRIHVCTFAVLEFHVLQLYETYWEMETGFEWDG
jgi:hypothetical protein